MNQLCKEPGAKKPHAGICRGASLATSWSTRPATAILYEDGGERSPGKRRTVGMMLAAVQVLILSKPVASIELLKPQFAIISKAELSGGQVWRETVNDDELYIWDNLADGVIYPNMGNGSLMGREFFSHNLSAGDWTYGLPAHTALLRSVGASNPARALMEREHTWLVSDDPGLVLSLLREYYGDEVEAVYQGELLGHGVWEFVLV